MSPSEQEGGGRARVPTLEEALAQLAGFLAARYPSRRPVRLVVAFADGEELRVPWPDQCAGEEVACAHSDDFRSVLWFGTPYRFTSSQAAVVRALWEARERGMPEVSGAVLLEAADSVGGRVRDIFKNSPAWEAGMVAQAGKGLYRLYAPGEAD